MRTNRVRLGVVMAAGGDFETDSKLLGDTLVALESVNKLTVTDENGQAIEFGSLFKDTKAIVFFVRVSSHSDEIGTILCAMVALGAQNHLF